MHVLPCVETGSLEARVDSADLGGLLLENLLGARSPLPSGPWGRLYSSSPTA